MIPVTVSSNLDAAKPSDFAALFHWSEYTYIQLKIGDLWKGLFHTWDIAKCSC